MDKEPKVNLFVGTWNVGTKKPPPDINDWLQVEKGICLINF
jgi:hypothetical protein